MYILLNARQSSHLVLKKEVTWKVFRELWKLEYWQILRCSFLIFILLPRHISGSAAILKKLHSKAVIWRYILSDLFYAENSNVIN